MRRAALLALAALATFTGTVSSQAFDPAPRPVAAPAPAPREHHVRVTVSGPPDTLMLVERGPARTPVELGGQPFDYAFVEPPGRTGYRSIAVFARSALPSPEPLRCRITVDGATVAAQSATRTDASGFAEIECRVPTPL